jgi:chemotaxis family two-component system response regulator Rcp1
LNNSKIIIADDDIDDRDLIERAFRKLGLGDRLHFAIDGEDLMKFLHEKQGNIGASIIFLDLNMPRKDGREALNEIKTSMALKKIPVIIFTTSRSKEDIESAYASGANCFISKSNTFPDLVNMLKQAVDFWFETATLPKVI